jgi:hypothetical protein
MRCFCVLVLLAWSVGSADVFVADQQRSADELKGTTPREQPQADIPREFEFLFHSFDQRVRDFANSEDLWKGLPYDSMSFERGGTGGCLVACATSTVTLYRATVSGVVLAPLDQAGRVVFRELRGRAELRTVAADMTSQPPAPRISELEGSVDIFTFAQLSYLLHRARFLQLPDEYDCLLCPADRPYTMLSVAAGGHTKTVIDYNVGRPVELWAIQQAFDSVSKSIQWTPK